MPGDVRKARKRVRRPSQAGRSRHGSAERKLSRRHHHHSSVPPHACTEIRPPPVTENETAPVSTKSHHRHRHFESCNNKMAAPESRNRRDSQEEIPPDAAYREGCLQGRSAPLRSKNHKGAYSTEQPRRSPEIRPTEVSVGANEVKNARQGPPLEVESWCHVDRRLSQETSPRNTSSTSLQDDRCSNGKHSDSGYDTLQAGRSMPGFTELLKFQNSNINLRDSSELIYPVHELNCGPSQARDPGKTKEEWSLTQNEPQLTKFSHQRPGGGKRGGEGGKDFTQSVDSPPKNIVQSRIKAFEIGNERDESSLIRESLQMQEPLKMSAPMYHPNEAHVSSLKSTEQLDTPAEESRRRRRKSDLCTFAFGDGGYSSKENPIDLYHRSQKSASQHEKQAKSVRDLLADFERKSQLMKERQAAEDERSNEGGPGKRCVFSDTETLLYDTSSDLEDVRQTTETFVEPQRAECGLGAVCSDYGEEDKDEEVAAALGRRERFFSSCRDLGRHRKRKDSKTGHTETDPTASDDLEVIVTPGYLRLSMAESLLTYDDSDSACGTPAGSQHCKSPGETGEASRDTRKGTDDDLANAEEHYMPMTPSKKAVLAPPDAFGNARSPSASQTVILENIFGGGGCEESSYVEMTDGVVRSLLASDPRHSMSKLGLNRVASIDSTPTYATPESPRYYEIDSNTKENGGVASHYEFLYKASTQYEPVYMEVSPLREALKVRDGFDMSDALQRECGDKDKPDASNVQDSSEKSKSGEEDAVDALPPTPQRTSLPDILNSSSTSVQQQKSDRDSSDADDEASKDLDSLDTPRHPRFSLSDTFRPASYYLGASSDRALIVLGSVPTSTAEQHDSSDSDLVSPPPIPTSPLPLDDFDVSLEPHDCGVKNQSPILSKADSESESTEKDEGKVWMNETSVSHEGRPVSALFPQPMYGLESGVRGCASKSLSLRKEQGLNSVDRLLKRRPLSDDVIGGLSVPEFVLPTPTLECRTNGSDLESVGSRSGLAMELDDGLSLDLDQYIEELQARDGLNVDTYSKDANYDYHRTFRNETQALNTHLYEIPERILPSCENTTENGERRSNHCAPDRDEAVGDSVQPPGMMNIAAERDSNRSIFRHSETSSPKMEVEYENLPPPGHSDDFVFDVPATTNLSDGTVRPGDRAVSRVEALGVDAQHAPYYYSDLLKGEDDGFASSASERSVNSSRGHAQHFVFTPVSTAARSTFSSRAQPLNNQRGDLIETSQFVKRNDIGRKVNAIHQSPGLPVPASPHHHVPSNEDANRLLAEELRSTTVHFLGAANKRGHVDERNLYEADTLQRRKATGGRGLTSVHGDRSKIPDVYGTANTVNLYPHGLRDKSSPLAGGESVRNLSHQPQRRSRSLEGLLEGPVILEGDIEPRSNLRSPRVNRMLQSSELTVSLSSVPHAVSQTHQSRSDAGVSVPTQDTEHPEADARERRPPPVQDEACLSPCEGNDLWEEDVLWRESLRRVSLRQTRSLDNLDGGRGARSTSRLSNSSAATTSTMEQSCRRSDPLSAEACARQKVTRDVTYVNESMARGSHSWLNPSRQKEYEDYREGRRRPQRRPQQSQSQDDGVHYERLSRYSESLERTRRGQTYLEGYVWDEDQETFRKRFLEDGGLPPQPSPSFEIDREKLRQWDLMSSAPLLQQQMLGGARQPRGAVVGADRAGVRRQLQQKPWSLLDLTVSHADETAGEYTRPDGVKVFLSFHLHFRLID